MPESLSRIFDTETVLVDYTKSPEELKNTFSLFTKVAPSVDSKTISSNVEQRMQEKAAQIY